MECAALPAVACAQLERDGRPLFRVGALQLPDHPRVRPPAHMWCPPWQITVHVTATVMPRNKGTPGLKPAVHCMGFTAETDTEAASDWQGFD